MPEIHLLATDLDGTLIGSANDFPLYSVFRDRLNDLRTRSDCYWVACTGRSLASFRRVFQPMRMLGLEPDFVIVSHAYVYSLTSFGYLPHLIWSLRVRWQIWQNARRVKGILRDWHRAIARMTLGSKTLLRKPDRLMLHFESEGSARVAARLLEDRIRPSRCIHVFQYRNHVDARPVPFTKGLALHELSQHLGIPREQVLAIGNGHNDMSMLDGTVAAMTGCPANSEAEVMSLVRDAGGHIASGAVLAGVLEAIDAWLVGQVNSSLPAGWQEPSEQPLPGIPRQKSRSEAYPQGCVRRTAFFLLVIYTMLLTFANFGLLPFSGWITKPYQWVVDLLARLVSYL